MAKQAVSNRMATTDSTPSHDEIAAQAYEIYLREGCVEGRDMDHWLRAEAELRERATNGNGIENGQVAGGSERQQPTSAPRVMTEQSSILPNSLTPVSTPIAQVTRGTTPRRNSAKREAAAVK